MPSWTYFDVRPDDPASASDCSEKCSISSICTEPSSSKPDTESEYASDVEEGPSGLIYKIKMVKPAHPLPSEVPIPTKLILWGGCPRLIAL